ncbi:FtsX-like permease family protein [Tumebacillus lipolyticus]|uniref:FtsX-like permease family protein n=1 Tax=Tumebacillus lipolyticus TaxID=1280370 RepID=A0ABW5A1H1_9BACL
MFKYILATAKSSSLFVTSVLLLALLLTTVPSALSSMQSSKLATNESIAQFGRGSYDLLVRPDSARTEIEKSKNIVEENFLTGGKGGISLEQYHAIKVLADVEYAAPVSVLGFFTNDTGGSVVDLPKPADGVKTTSIRISAETGLASEYNVAQDTNVMSFPFQDFPILPSRSLEFRHVDQHYQVNLTLPAIYNLIVAVDPEQEELITGKQLNIFPSLPLNISGSREATEVDSKNITQIPLLINEDIKVPLKVVLEERSPQGSAQIWRQKAEQVYDLQKDGGPFFAEALKTPTDKSTHYDLTPFLDPFQVKKLVLENDGKVRVGSGGLSSMLLSSVYYQTDRLHYAPSTDLSSDLELIPSEKSGTTYYRPLVRDGLAEDHVQKNISLYKFSIVGKYKGEQVGNDPLNPSPLGIYTFSPVRQIIDRNGEQVNNLLTKDITPDTFLPIQASALTNLEAAEYLKGDTPIDAIRVRVSGIEKYDEHAEAKILQVAEQIQKTTGLHTDVIAGASKQNVRVSIPAVGDRPAVGVVQEVWTTLGIATQIKEAVNQLSIWVTVAMAIITILYSTVHTQTLFLLRKKEFTILQAIGWSMRDISKMLMLEWVIKAGAGFLLSLVLMAILSAFIEFPSFWLICIGVQLLIAGLLLLTVFLTVKRMEESELKLGKDAEWKQNKTQLHSILGISWGNFKGQFKYNAWNILLIAISGAVALFTFNLVLASNQNIGTTFLGSAVNAASNASQWLIIFASMSMVVYGLFEASRALVAKRDREIYILRVIGWSVSHITKLIVNELLLVFGIGCSLALLIGFGSFRILFDKFPVTPLLQTGALLGGVLLLLIVALSNLRRRAQQLH